MLLVASVEPIPGRPTTFVSLGLLNARPVVSKAALVHDVISDLRLDVRMLTETRMTSDAPDAVKLDVTPPLYQVVHQPRGSSTDKRGGGIAIVHRDSIKVRPFDVGTPTEFEVQVLKLMLRPSKQVIIVCVYRPPGSVLHEFCSQLADMLDQLVLFGQRFVLCGDFNCPGTSGNPLDANHAHVLQC